MAEDRLLDDLGLHKAFCAPLAIRYGVADGEALRHCIRIVKEECAKTASIKDAEIKQAWDEAVKETTDAVESTMEAQCEAKIAEIFLGLEEKFEKVGLSIRHLRILRKDYHALKSSKGRIGR